MPDAKIPTWKKAFLRAQAAKKDEVTRRASGSRGESNEPQSSVVSRSSSLPTESQAPSSWTLSGRCGLGSSCLHFTPFFVRVEHR
jgi:hypothetical protein